MNKELFETPAWDNDVAKDLLGKRKSNKEFSKKEKKKLKRLAQQVTTISPDFVEKEKNEEKKSVKKKKKRKKKKSTQINDSIASVSSSNKTLLEHTESINKDSKIKLKNKKSLIDKSFNLKEKLKTKKDKMSEKINNKKSLNLPLNKMEKHKIKLKKIFDEYEKNPKSPKNKKETLRQRMIRQLLSSRFRYLNEQMYCSKGYEAMDYFKSDPDAFLAYHNGYQHQVKHWPVNPLDIIIQQIKKKPSNWVIADMGCGDAKLARSVSQDVHSFDLVALNDQIVACDMARTPLGKASVDMVVFCLSLMGTNIGDFLLEANRILKLGGILKIAEVASRFEKIDDFTSKLNSYGYKCTLKDLNNNYFYFLDFKKEKEVRTLTNLSEIILNPCLYKKR